MAATLNAKDLPPQLLKQLGIRTATPRSFTKETVRSRVLKTLASLADLTQDQRRRVLEQAIRINRL